MQQEPTKKTPVEIEAPSAEQIRAAKKMRRQQQAGFLPEPTEQKKIQRRSGLEGVVLMLLAMALAYFLYPLGTLAWIIAALPFLGGIIVLMKGWQ
jgi:cytochrome c-type biogenesis protein CcmH/NrfG